MAGRALRWLAKTHAGLAVRHVPGCLLQFLDLPRRRGQRGGQRLDLPADLPRPHPDVRVRLALHPAPASGRKPQPGHLHRGLHRLALRQGPEACGPRHHRGPDRHPALHCPAAARHRSGLELRQHRRLADPLQPGQQCQLLRRPVPGLVRHHLRHPHHRRCQPPPWVAGGGGGGIRGQAPGFPAARRIRPLAACRRHGGPATGGRVPVLIQHLRGCRVLRAAAGQCPRRRVSAAPVPCAGGGIP